MLYHIFFPLSNHISFLNLFRYITFRSFLAFFFVLSFVLFLQPRFIEWFRRRSLSQPIRSDGPQAHQIKVGTPTMGGLIVVVGVVCATLLFARLDNIYIWSILGLTCAYGVLGFFDDWKKVQVKTSAGISARAKLFWQIFAACFFIWLVVQFGSGFTTELNIPFFKNLKIDLGYWYIPFAAFVIVGCSNAVNLTDGLDGLVSGPIISVASAYGIFAYVAGNSKIATHLQIPYVAGTGELSVFTAAVVAGGLGFLWFNAFPAQVFMGDIGALALGGALGMMAVLTKQEIVLVVAGGVFVVEALSVMLQVASYKLTGKRIFKMAPLHHHFELNGLQEPKIIVRCWIISIVLALLALATLKIR